MSTHDERPLRFRFGPYVLSPRQRSLTRDGREVPLIPRYFDLLVLLVRRRHEAVHRSDIFATVWSEVVVSDGALTQAVRALRRALADDPREPVFIRTVSRHGYRFVYAEVSEEPEEQRAERPNHEGASAVERDAEHAAAPRAAAPDVDYGALLDRLRANDATDDERHDAAERLHALGTGRAIEQIGDGPGRATAIAVLRDARWDVPGAEPVPLWGTPGGWHAAVALVGLRARRAWRLAGRRWLGSVLGATTAGIVTGFAGGIALWLMPGAQAPPTAAAVLALVGAVAGATGAAGVGGGLSATEAIARSWRLRLLPVAGAFGGFLVGTIAHWLARWTLDALFGLARAEFGGPLEGLVIGAAAGLGYAWATSDVGEGMAAPRGSRRAWAAAIVSATCALAAVLLGVTGRPMVGGLINAIAEASRVSPLTLAPLARAIGEPEFGALTAAAVGAVEGAAFGCGLVLGLTRRPRSGR